jgi:hypothetical protein
MNVWSDRWAEGWMGVSTNRQINGWMDRLAVRQLEIFDLSKL